MIEASTLNPMTWLPNLVAPAGKGMSGLVKKLGAANLALGKKAGWGRKRAASGEGNGQQARVEVLEPEGGGGADGTEGEHTGQLAADAHSAMRSASTAPPQRDEASSQLAQLDERRAQSLGALPVGGVAQPSSAAVPHRGGMAHIGSSNGAGRRRSLEPQQPVDILHAVALPSAPVSAASPRPILTTTAASSQDNKPPSESDLDSSSQDALVREWRGRRVQSLSVIADEGQGHQQQQQQSGASGRPHRLSAPEAHGQNASRDSPGAGSGDNYVVAVGPTPPSPALTTRARTPTSKASSPVAIRSASALSSYPSAGGAHHGSLPLPFAAAGHRSLTPDPRLGYGKAQGSGAAPRSRAV